MRIILRFTPNTTPMNAINQHLVNNYIYRKCLGQDSIFHDAKNDYCISHLYGGKMDTASKTVNFPNGAIIAVTSENDNFLGEVIKGAMKNTNFSNGMTLKTFEFIPKENFLNGWNYFATLSPFIIKEYSSKKHYKYIVFNDESFFSKSSEKTRNKLVKMEYNEFSIKLTQHMKNKLIKVYPELSLDNFKIEVIKHPQHKIKTVFKEFDHINKKCVEIFANQCHLNVFCDKTIAERIYNIGIGQSTGSGFGTIYKTENHRIYKK